MLLSIDGLRSLSNAGDLPMCDVSAGQFISSQANLPLPIALNHTKSSFRFGSHAMFWSLMSKRMHRTNAYITKKLYNSLPLAFGLESSR